jgi:hypothetical protein
LKRRRGGSKEADVPDLVITISAPRITFTDTIVQQV